LPRVRQLHGARAGVAHNQVGSDLVSAALELNALVLVANDLVAGNLVVVGDFDEDANAAAIHAIGAIEDNVVVLDGDEAGVGVQPDAVTLVVGHSVAGDFGLLQPTVADDLDAPSRPPFIEALDVVVLDGVVDELAVGSRGGQAYLAATLQLRVLNRDLA